MSNHLLFVLKSEIDSKEWDNLIFESPEGWLYQTSAWISYAEKWGSQSLCFGVRSKNGELLAVFPIYRDDLTVKRFFRIKRLYTGLSGPVISKKVDQKSRLKLWKAMFEYVDHLAEQNNINVLQVRLTTLAPAYLPPLRPEINPLFYVGLTSPLKIGFEEAIQSLTRILYLEKSEEELLMDMDADCRAAIKQAERKGLKSVLANDIEDVRNYVSLHKESWLRTGLSPHPFEYFEEMWNKFHDEGAMQILFAEFEGKKIAGIIIHVFKQGVFYWGGCSATGSLSLRPNNYLLWRAVRWAKHNGCKWFEIGHFYPHPCKDTKEYNVGKFKTQFGKDALVPFDGQKIYKTERLFLLEFFRQAKKMLKK